MVNVAVAEKVPETALIDDVVLVVTVLVVTLNVAVFAPAAIVTLAGTVATVLELDNVSLAPAVPAAPLMVTVAVDVAPPCTFDGDNEIDFGSTGSIVKVAVLVLPP